MGVIAPEDDPIVEWITRRVYESVASRVNKYPRDPCWSVGKMKYSCLRNGFYNMVHEFEPDKTPYIDAGLKGYELMFAGMVLHDNIEILPIQELHLKLVDTETGEDLMFGHLDDVYYDGHILIDKKTLEDVKPYTKKYLPRSQDCRQLNYYRALLKYGVAVEDVYDIEGFKLAEKGTKLGWGVKEQYLVYMPMNSVLTNLMVAKPEPEYQHIATRVIYNRLLEKREILESYIAADTPPKQQPSWECRYCDWFSECFGDPENANVNMPDELFRMLKMRDDL